MRRSLLSAAALLTAFAMPLVAVAPASAANPDLSSFTFDCDANTDFYYQLPLYEPTVEVSFVNCDSDLMLVDPTDSENASTSGGLVTSSGILIATATVNGPMFLQLWDASGFNLLTDLEFITPFQMPNPSGVQLADSSQDIESDAPVADWGTSRQIADGDEISIGGIDGCEITPGEHVYATQSFTVSEAGDYTFRVLGVDPTSEYLNPFLGGSELDDPMVALYSEFNFNNPATGIVGCNDDLNDLEFGGHDYGDIDYNETQQGDYIEGHFSYFSATLDPGDYMLVFTTWDDTGAEEWAEETPSGGTVYFDVWGPESGLDLTDVAPTDGPSAESGGSLANTGVDPTFALWTALFLVSAGAAILITRRQRDRV